jgi:S1-C subfamily serine protease
VLTAVHGGSLAERAGLLVQDLLLAVNGKSVNNITALRDVSAAAGHEQLQLDVLRQQKPIRLLLKPE